MSYATNIDKENIDRVYMLVLKPRRRVTSWSVAAGSVYRNTFSYGHVIGVKITGTALTEGSSSTLAAGEFYYDPETTILYIRKSDSTAPSGSDYIVATYEINLATSPLNWYRKPTDSTTREVHWQGAVIDSPDVFEQVEDSVFGFQPVTTTSAVIENATGLLMEHLYDSSFKDCDIDMYSLVGELDTANIQKIYSGLVESAQGSNENVSLQINSRYAIFERNFDGQFFPSTISSTAVDPSYIGRPIPYIYGMVEGVRGVNVDYLDPGSSTTNDKYIFGQAGVINATKGGITHHLGPALGVPNSVTKTHLQSTAGLRVGDRMKLTNGVASLLHAATQTRYVEILTIGDDGDPYITHAALASAMSPFSGEGDCFAYQVPRVSIIQDGKKYEAYPGRDYSVSTSSYLSITFVAGYDTSIGLPRVLSASDTVFARVYGQETVPTFSAAAVGAVDTETGSLCNPISILYDILKSWVGISESDIDGTTFDTLADSFTERIGFCTPFRSTDEFPTYHDIIEQILGTCLLRLAIDENNKWTVTQIGPLDASAETLTESDMRIDSYQFDVNFQEVLSDVVVEYALRDISENPNEYIGIGKRVYATSDYAKYVHNITRQKTFYSLHFESTDAQTLATRLSYIFGDRQMKFRLRSGPSQADRQIGEVVTVSAQRVPGYSFSEGTEQTRDAVVIGVQKQIDSTSLSLDDQKGIEDNSGSW